MTRTIAMFAAVVLMLASIAVAGEETAEKPWFDPENCIFCKNTDMSLLSHMNCTYHELDNGLMSVTVIDEGYLDSYKEMQAKMQKMGEEIMASGETPPMCQHCSKFGEFHPAGVKMEHVMSDVGDIHLMISDKPEMIAKLHKFGMRTNEEMAKMKESMKTQTASEGTGN